MVCPSSLATSVRADKDFRKLTIDDLPARPFARLRYYHTSKDTLANLERGSTQHFGENVLAIVDELLGKESELSGIEIGVDLRQDYGTKAPSFESRLEGFVLAFCSGLTSSLLPFSSESLLFLAGSGLHQVLARDGAQGSFLSPTIFFPKQVPLTPCDPALCVLVRS